MRYPTLPLLLLVIVPAIASAEVIDFEDLGHSGGGTHMPDTYAGLRWDISAWHYLSASSGNNYLALSTSSTLVLAASASAEFYFHGADFWSRRAADANADFYFVLYRDGVTVYNGLEDSNGRQRFDGVPGHFTPAYNGLIDAFALAFDNDDYDHLAMDNLNIAVVPEPASASLLALAFLASGRRRR